MPSIARTLLGMTRSPHRMPPPPVNLICPTTGHSEHAYQLDLAVYADYSCLSWGCYACGDITVAQLVRHTIVLPLPSYIAPEVRV